jgi:hypothetical protein
MDINILINVIVGLLAIFVPVIFSMMMRMFARNDKIISDIVEEQRHIAESMSNCQVSMPKEYVLKADYKSDMAEIKVLLGDQSKKIDQIWKHMRISNGKD